MKTSLVNRKLFIIAFLIMGTGLHSQARAQSPASFTGILDRVNSLNVQNSIACGDSKLSTGLAHHPSFFESQKCDQLFATDVPAWVKKSRQGGVLATPGNWQPLCSLKNINDYATLGFDTKAEQLAEANKFTADLDVCSHPKDDRFLSEFHVKSQNEAKVALLSDADLALLQAKFLRLRDQATKTCCATDDVQCKSLMGGVAAVRCLAQKDPNLPDQCVGIPNFYKNDDFENYLTDHAGDPNFDSIAKSNMPVTSGYLAINPFRGAKDQDYLISHELGHACSTIKRQIELAKGSTEEIAASRVRKDCVIDSDTQTVYHKLFTALNLTESESCFIKYAEGMPHKRFVAGECPNACPKLALEEGLGEVFYLLMLNPNNSELGFDSERVCAGERDSHHIMLPDALRCAIQSPAQLKKLEDLTRCAR